MSDNFTRYIVPNGGGIADHPSGLLYRREEVDPVVDALRARILAEAEVIKAAEALAEAVDDQLVYMDMCDDIGDLEKNLRATLTNFLHAQARAKKGGE